MRQRLAALLIVALLPTLAQAAGAWSDSSTLQATTLFGPNLAIDGSVISAEVALPNAGGVDDSRWSIGSTIVAKSVMTGHDSFFPSTLPSSLKVQHLVPDSTHPNLAFWYTPDVFERDSLGDGAKVTEWKSVANICHDKHSLRATLCAGAKQRGSQAVAGGNNMYVAALRQAAVASQPIYKKKIANGHGVVRFQRTASDGTAGSYMAMDQRCASNACAAASTTEGWGVDSDFSTNIGNNGMTVMMVVKMSQSATDRNNMGIMHLNAAAADKNGFALYASESKCMPVLWGSFPLYLYGTTRQILNGLTLSIVKLAVSSSPTPSPIQNYYSGMTLKVFGSAVDTNTGEQTRTHVCTIDKYLFGGRTTAPLSAGGMTVTILGGGGMINGKAINTLFLAVGCTNPNACTGGVGAGINVVAITSIADSSGNTAITVASLTSNFVVGTQVYVCLESDGSNCIIASTSGACDVTTDPADIGTFEIWKDATTTGAPFCPSGKTRQFGTFNAYVNDGKDDNSCASECATATQNGCNKETGDLGAGLTCAGKHGTLGRVADANEGFKIVAVTINAARTGYRGYVNGFHEGCDLSTGFDGCAAGKITPPILYASAAAATAFAHMRLGVLDLGNAGTPATNFASMDMAEMMIYDKQLTAEEMDRIGNYMANKYAIDDFIVNDDVRSPSRTKALSMSAGCGPTRRKTHSGIFGKGFVPSTAAHYNSGGTWYHNKVSLQDSIAIDKADYYVGARLRITGGNGNTAGTVISAMGQSCVITDYVVTTKLATCDFTHQGEFGYVKYGTTAASKDYASWINDLTIAPAVVNAVAAADVTLYATWRPADYTTPYIAVLGDPDSASVEAVRVTSAVYQDTDSLLTVVRGVSGTTPLALTNADSKARAAAAKITYAHAITMGDVGATDTYIITSGVGLLYDLPTVAGITNWFAKLSLTGTPTRTVEVVQVTAANAPTFTVTADVAASAVATTVDLAANGQNYMFSILADDVLRVQCLECGTGELVTVTALKARTNGGGTSVWDDVGISAVVNANGFKAGNLVTLVQRKLVPNPSILTVVRARETTTAAVFALGAAQVTLVDFMYMPQNLNSVGDSWVGGSGVSTYQIYDCDVEAVPHVRDSPIQTFTGNGYLKGPSVGLSGATSDTLTTGASLWYSASVPDSSTSVAVGPAAGGQVVVIKGWNLMPLDTNIRYVADDPTDSYDLQRMENYLQVTVGQRPRECRDPTLLSAPCQAGTSVMGETALSCQIIEAGAGYCANDFTKVCRCLNRACADCSGNAVCNMHSSTLATSALTYEATKNIWAQTRKPTVQCALPAVLGADSNDLNIYWHGVRTTLTNWYRPESPTIESIEPASAPYSGGSVITIHGRNFGPKVPYTQYTAGGAKTPSSKSSMVEIHGKSFAAACTTTTWVSDKQLLCTVPALPARKTAGINTAQRTVEVQVIVSAQGSRNAQNAHSILTYSSVPTYYTCEYKSTSEAAKRDCFTCCRSACIVDEFALGGVKGGSTFSHCDSTCYSYCGYTTVA